MSPARKTGRKAASGSKKKGQRILVIDIGGSFVKLMLNGEEDRKIRSGKSVSPRQSMANIRKETADWTYDAVSLGFPAPVREGEVIKEPTHLAPGWIKWNFESSLRKPARVINDAALQALGSYHGGRMLFLGLGTGLGSALVWGRNVLSLELGHLPFPGVPKLEDRMGKNAYENAGRKKWEREVLSIVKQMKKALIADYIVLGGGLSQVITKLPDGIEHGNNRNARQGGERLWEMDAHGNPKWNVV